jgi:glycosyltransferase involved in cell wall biosynthesis
MKSNQNYPEFLSANGDLGSSCVLIPALNPSSTLLQLLADLLRQGFGSVVIVDDGSSNDFQTVFKSAADSGAVVIRHPINLGKGEALKTAFRYAQKHEFKAVVTVDADGQHSASDAARITRRVLTEKLSVCVLGVRTFKNNVPLRSKFGNVMTRNVVRAFSSLSVSDTQTGLRGFSANLLPKLCEVKGHRYEFEMQILLYLARSKVPLFEVPIDTIYIDNNSSSHFRPVIDSLKIYWVLFRDIFISLSSFGIDIAIFTLFHALTDNVLFSTYVARLISGAYNFLGSRIFVFKTVGNSQMKQELVQYIFLAIALATASGNLVHALEQYSGWNVVACKIFIDLMLYSVSFLVRRLMIFKEK